MVMCYQVTIVLESIGIIKSITDSVKVWLFSLYLYSHTLTNQNHKPPLNALNEHTNYLSVFYYKN